MSEYYGKISDLPLDEKNNFIPNSEKRVVFGPNGRFCDDYVVRCFKLHPGSKSALHQHAWPHVVVCLGGKGVFKIGDEEALLERGSWAFVPGDMMHIFWNASEDSDWEFLCLVPPEGDVNPLLGGC
ncbi:MAG: cupin domain-containing protein [Eubacteriaceae bacterium]|jgi:quercetin dioxygenase-like cupin family protein|nr:cupin domain-containing protein [Eubacteriaceae bacterium]